MPSPPNVAVPSTVDIPLGTLFLEALREFFQPFPPFSSYIPIYSGQWPLNRSVTSMSSHLFDRMMCIPFCILIAGNFWIIAINCGAIQHPNSTRVCMSKKLCGCQPHSYFNVFGLEKVTEYGISPGPPFDGQFWVNINFHPKRFSYSKSSWKTELGAINLIF